MRNVPVVIGLFTAVLLLGAGVPKDPPPPVTLSGAVESEVTSGKIYIDSQWDQGTNRYITFAVVNVAAPPENVIDAAVDLKARVGEVSAITGVNVYTNDPGLRGGEWALSILGSTSKFSVLYQHDRSRGWCYFYLDKSRKNDIVAVEGSYQAYPHGAGSRLVYRGFSDSGSALPGFVTRWLSNNGLEAQLSGIKKRAERT